MAIFIPGSNPLGADFIRYVPFDFLTQKKDQIIVYDPILTPHPLSVSLSRFV